MKWQPIETAPLNRVRVLLNTGWGVVIGRYLEFEDDGTDSIGHDAGWISEEGETMVGRSFGNPSYMHESTGQPTHWMPLPECLVIEDE